MRRIPGVFLLLLALACGRGDGDFAATGTIEVDDAQIAPEAAGRLVALRVREGDVVRAGDTLAVLEATATDADLAREEAAVRGAAAELADLRAGARREEIDQAAAALRRAEAERILADSTARRVAPLAASGVLPRQQGDEARAALASATERATAAREALALLRRGARPDAIAAAEARLRQAQAARNARRARADALVLLAPWAGRVRGTWADAGEWIPAGRAVLTLADDRHPWVRVYVGQAAFTRLTPGARGTGHFDADPATVPVRVLALSDRAELTPRVALTDDERADLMFWVKLAIDDSTGRAKAGLPLTVRFP